jgi:hypothetical protein
VDVFFALRSGTLESIVYDTLVEETGGSEGFEQTIGRVRVVESVSGARRQDSGTGRVSFR